MRKNYIIIAAVAVVLILTFFVIKFINSPGFNRNQQEEGQATESFSVMLNNASGLLEQGELLQAQEVFKKILATYAWRPGIEDVQKKLESLNMRILVSGLNVPEKTESYIVKEGDSIAKIAKNFETTSEFIKRQNGLASDLIKPGMKLRIWKGKFSVAVDKSQNVLLLKSYGEVVKSYDVSTGKDNITPTGSFKIVNKLVNPAWTHDGKVIPPNSPDNILGSRWLGFDLSGYGIHGTTQPETIGKQVTAGCVRLKNSDAEELYDLLPLGTEVIVMD